MEQLGITDSLKPTLMGKKSDYEQKFTAACSADGKSMVVLGSHGNVKVFTTKDSGKTWTLGHALGAQCREVAFCGSNKNYLVAGTYNDKRKGLVVSKDFGGT